VPDLVAAVAEPNRRRLLQLLGHGEQTVTALAGNFAVSRSAISQHLGVLAEAGLVVSRRDGRFQYYRLIPEGVAALRAELTAFWTSELDQLVSDACDIARRSAPEGATLMPFEKSVLVPLAADETFALITEPERLRRWQVITARVDLRAGGDYRWTIIPGSSASGTFTEVEIGKRVVFTWGWEGSADLPPGASTVTITLEPAEGGTMVRLVHDGLTPEQAASHAEGWNHYLGRLAVAAASGDAGADPWAAAAPRELDSVKAAEAALAACQLALRGVTEADSGRATSCAEFSVAQLADHLLGSITHLGGAAGAQFPAANSAAAPALEAQVADAAQAALEAWNARGLDGVVKAAGNELPAIVAIGILSIELLVHAWDFAQATGQQVTVADEVSQHVLDAAHKIITPAGRAQAGFDDAVQAGPDAGALDRLIAFTGRAA
jgi:uncharacterized protein (TIGR03086 family)